ncbi:DUF4124 domain-containing protein [Luteimonas sp. BDR2-5]|uniref:DUF4124 domain-containing protein n=1 Tax=Proluteimonas luteida TaxID=2878685 RepID=UPI001E5E685C|nr:DUF4124 domain-containing protein [Luteimonas sp. BDR2-5]MCD9027328.1 DUF4124 domain-containing protein [Luteimonas sp. BDR2-5]
MRHLPHCLFLLAIAAAPLAASEVYSWKDANGVTHYSQTPPPAGTHYELRNVRGDGSTGVATPAATPEPAPATTAAATPDANTQCELARGNIEALQGDSPVHQAGADGTPRELDAAERSNQLALAQAAERAYCR